VCVECVKEWGRRDVKGGAPGHTSALKEHSHSSLPQLIRRTGLSFVCAWTLAWAGPTSAKGPKVQRRQWHTTRSAARCAGKRLCQHASTHTKNCASAKAQKKEEEEEERLLRERETHPSCDAPPLPKAGREVAGIATDCKTVAPFSSHLSQVLNGALLCTSRKTASHNAVMPSPYFVSEDLVVDRST
jgi:hypothetical protein